MAGRRFEVADVVKVLQHWQAGRSRRQLARGFGMGRNRVDRIVAAAEAAGRSPGGRRSAAAVGTAGARPVRRAGGGAGCRSHQGRSSGSTRTSSPGWRRAR
jgi:hypothetical protein